MMIFCFFSFVDTLSIENSPHTKNLFSNGFVLFFSGNWNINYFFQFYVCVYVSFRYIMLELYSKTIACLQPKRHYTFEYKIWKILRKYVILVINENNYFLTFWTPFATNCNSFEFIRHFIMNGVQGNKR